MVHKKYIFKCCQCFFFLFRHQLPLIKNVVHYLNNPIISLPKEAYCHVRLILDEGFRRREQKCVWKVYRQTYFLTKDEQTARKPHVKSLVPIHRRIYGNAENNRFDSFVYTNKQYSSFFFQSYMYIHQNYKEIQNSKP